MFSFYPTVVSTPHCGTSHFHIEVHTQIFKSITQLQNTSRICHTSDHMEEETGACVSPPVMGRVIPQTCLVCGDVVSSRLVLERHMRALHLLHKPYDCKKCGAMFNNRRELGSHQANLHRCKKVTCKHCPYSAISKAHMHLHVQVHTRGMKCSKCDKKCPSLSAKLAHEKLHCGARTTYDCEHCDKSYVTYVQKRHLSQCGSM